MGGLDSWEGGVVKMGRALERFEAEGEMVRVLREGRKREEESLERARRDG